jgi:hypothetical protein
MPITDTPGAWSPSIYAGATWTRTLAVTSGTAVIDLTGYDARLKARTSYTAGSAAISLGTADGITLGGTAGTIGLTLAGTTTAALGSALDLYTTGQAAQLVYDLELESAGGDVTQLLRGVLTVWPEATR